MLEFIEKFNADGIVIAFLRGAPPGMMYMIKERTDGRCECKSSTNSAGSIRYYSFRNYGEAVDHGIAWGKRKLREQRRAA